MTNSDFGGSANGGAGNDLLFGSNDPFAFSTLDGGAGNDALQAGTGGGYLIGADGKDLLRGADGNDYMSGGTGVDRFVFGEVWSASTFSGDSISDFEDGVEKIDLRGTGLTFEDLTIENVDYGSFAYATITNETAGFIEVRAAYDENFVSRVVLDRGDFLFG